MIAQNHKANTPILFAVVILALGLAPAAWAGSASGFPSSFGTIHADKVFAPGEQGVVLYCAAKTDPSGNLSLAVLMDTPDVKSTPVSGWTKPGESDALSTPPCSGLLGPDFQVQCSANNSGLYQITRRCIRDTRTVLGLGPDGKKPPEAPPTEKDIRNDFISWWGGFYAGRSAYSPPTYLKVGTDQ